MINYDGNNQLDRSDSIQSVSLVQDTFERLKFDVKINQDLSDVDLKNKLKEFLGKKECILHDCFVLYIHSHGKENGFITANMKKIGFNEIMQMFSNQNCKNFIKKPKIIFFDCCREGMYLIGIDNNIT